MEKKKRFSEKIEALEEIVEKLNSDIEIEDAVHLYEKGVKLARSVKKYLGEAEKKIAVLSSEGVRDVDENELGRKSPEEK